jgi:ABC-type antimicrobial peptide transport system permease subunit
MNLLALIFSEIKFHRINFGISVVSLGIIVCILLLSSSYVFSQYQDEIIVIKDKETETKALMNTMVTNYKSITDRMGYTIRILPQNQSLDDFYNYRFGGKYLSEHVLDTVMTLFSKEIRCVLPVLQIKSQWSKVKRSVLFSGLGTSRSFAEYKLPPSIPKITDGSIALGFELPTYPEAIKGSKVNIKGKTYTIISCEAQRGSIDDITVWMSLTDLQESFSIPEKISEIWVWPVLDTAHSISGLATQIESSLKSCKVICISAPSVMQMKARETAVAIAKETITTEKKANEIVFLKHKKYLLIFSIVSVLACSILISILVLQNVSVRQEELMILRVIGYPDFSIIKMLGARGLCLGFCGTSLGLIGGFLILFLLHQKIGFPTSTTILKSYALCAISTCLGIVSGILVTRTEPMRVLNRADQCV